MPRVLCYLPLSFQVREPHPPGWGGGLSPETQRAPSSWSVRPETQPACQPTMPEEYENGTDCPRGVRVAWCQAAGPHLGKLIDAPCHLLPASQCVQKRHTGCGAASVEIARACDNLVAFSQTKEFDGGGGSTIVQCQPSMRLPLPWTHLPSESSMETVTVTRSPRGFPEMPRASGFSMPDT